ncbi:sialate O-acetylesterase [Aestuariivivens insulae]|uniref:sialate O-acetylesterase n=1 Tax=Aestuariivivens insulae TaxID=1621988 RepID=UPI001F563ADF|nr:sialate O-acetylesterase [Aestuariivivens insulae]
MKKIILGLVCSLSITSFTYAKIWLPSILSNNMVLQQQSEATIWGWTTNAAETITVTASWHSEPFTTKAYQGVWSLKLPTPKAGGPYTITITGHEVLELKNVLIGEVWFCSGQSNMEWSPLKGLVNAEQEIKAANYPKIRLFSVNKKKSEYKQDDAEGVWEFCRPETMKNFSSVAYFFGRKLHNELDVPIGLVNSSWGGTPIETWIDKAQIEAHPDLKAASQKIKDYVWWPRDPGVTYNSMVHPFTNFDIAGCLWYQGESNRQNAKSYYKSLPLMIETWRNAWGKGLPFYFVQIAPFAYNDFKDDVPLVRDAQLQTMITVKNTGMVVTNDIGNLKNIHPTNKQEVGKRLALWALAKTYGVKHVVYSGPIYKQMEIKRNKAIIYFDHAEGGLNSKGEELKAFYIAGADKEFHPAKAKIIGNVVEVYAKKVKYPVAVRFAFSDDALPNLFNASGLPASAFKTDTWIE